jgi:hypothetical protein
MAWAIQNEINLDAKNKLLKTTIESADEAFITIDPYGK